MGRNLEQTRNLAHGLQSDFSDSFLYSASADHPNCSRHCDVTRVTDVISYIYYIRNGRLGFIQEIGRNASQNTVVYTFLSQMLMSCKKDK